MAAFYRTNISHALGAVTAESLADMGATASQIANADLLTITADAATSYLVGSTPTATWGHVLKADETTEFATGDFASMNFISQSGTANLTVTIEGYA